MRVLCRWKEALHNLQGSRAESSIYGCLLDGCIAKKALAEGELLHAHIIHTGFKQHGLLGTKLVIVYAKCGCLADARRALDEMPKPDVVSYTALIAAYARHGLGEDALALFRQMERMGIEPDRFTFASVLPACANLAALEVGKKVHEGLIRSGLRTDVVVDSALVDMYDKCGSIEDARHVFDKMSKRNVVSWTAMIAAYARHGRDEESLALFRQMQRIGILPNQFTFASVLPACANLAALEHGKEVHDDIIRRGFQSNIIVGNALVDMYAKCGSIQDAHQVFDKMPERNVVAWTSMVGGYAQGGYVSEALNLFHRMPERDVVAWNAMMGGYAQSGCVDKALELFQKMPEQNVASWNTMIAGYTQNGHFNEALKFLRQMHLTGVRSNPVTFASVLPACANLAALENGRAVHRDVIRNGFHSDVFVGNALVDMYAKCGSIDDARVAFDGIPERNVISWNVMIVGYGMHGCGKEALQLFEQMRHSGTKPNHVTFIGVLSACCHSGLVEDGLHFFDSISQEYHMTPVQEHYCCMVDLLGRAGRLDDAYAFINKMPIEPNAAVWGSLLGACRIHNNMDLGECVAECLFRSDSKNSAHYVLLSNIYATAGRWDDVEKVRKMMKERNVRKSPGCSWIEVNNNVYTFLGGDDSHPEMDEISALLERLSGQMKEAGYVPDTDFVLHDVEQQQKEHILCYHSEKLAIAFGLIHTPSGTPIRIIKNLRMCGDCHSAIKFISKIATREIHVRDSNRFHHFKDGICSCGNYW